MKINTSITASDPFDFKKLETDLKALRDSALKLSSAPENKEDSGFSHLLTQGIKDVNLSLKDSERMTLDLASGKSNNIHETMLSATRAELSFQMLVQLRNKAIEAYQDVMRMQV